jgi:hypothetical protein
MYTNTKLLKLIDEHGMDDIEPILENIENFNDLCIFGKAFIENKVYRHIDYLGMFGKSEDSNGHDSVTDNLIQLHQFGIVTTGGQINTISLCENIYLQQRSYLTFYCTKEVSNTIINELFLKTSIYTIVYTNDSHIIHNVPKEDMIKDSVNVTRTTTNDFNNKYDNHSNIWLDRREGYYYDFVNSDSEEELESINFDELFLNECLFITLIFKEYKNFNKSEDVSSILLEIVKKCNVPQLIE